ncbi:MAG: polysaccharide pyruvyl transferase family protein, partial [Fuerstia sp.]|nr:polysaccharide pyruvyl transferase family protein [Fuerstiella sp.]
AAIVEAGIEIEEALPWPDMPSSASDADAILLHGGGNFGDLYREHMEFRLEVSGRFKSRRIIWLPQSIAYQCPQQAAADMQQLAAFENLEIWLRDGVSLAKAISGGLSRCRLVPDGIFGLRTTPAGFSAVGSRLEIRRSDRESQLPPGPSEHDWMLPGSTMPHGENEAWDLAESRFRNVRMVVTDRLHVHLLCVLSDIPNVLVADSFGKNRAMFCTWTHMHNRSRFVSHWAQVHEAENELTASLAEEGV